MGNKELFKTVLFGGFQKEEVWNYMQEVEAASGILPRSPS